MRWVVDSGVPVGIVALGFIWFGFRLMTQGRDGAMGAPLAIGLGGCGLWLLGGGIEVFGLALAWVWSGLVALAAWRVHRQLVERRARLLGKGAAAKAHHD